MKKRPCPLATVSSRWPPLPPVRCAVKGLRNCSRAPWKELCAACISAVLQRWSGQCGSRWGKGRCRWANAEGWGGYLFMLSRLAAGAAWAHGPHIGHYACLTRFPARFVGGDGATCQRTDVSHGPCTGPPAACATAVPASQELARGGAQPALALQPLHQRLRALWVRPQPLLHLLLRDLRWRRRDTSDGSGELRSRWPGALCWLCEVQPQHPLRTPAPTCR